MFQFHTLDAVLAGFALTVYVVVARTRLTWWGLGAAAAAIVVCAAGWIAPLAPGPIGRLLPAYVVVWVLPGFLLLELLFGHLARQLDWLERPPVILALTLTAWAAVAAIGYRLQLGTDLVAALILAAEACALATLFIRVRRRPADETPASGNDEATSATPYLVALMAVIIGVSVVVGLTTRFQRYDFDASFHMAGYDEVATSERLVAVNPYLGPPFPFWVHYVANPGYLAFGLTARLARSEVTWFYVLFAALLTPLFFFCLYALVRALLNHRWIAAVATLLAIGLWISQMALAWGPGFGSFYLQFLPSPGTYAQLILFPTWIACAFRYLATRQPAWAALSAMATVGAMALHPDALLGLPYGAGLVAVAMLLAHGMRPVWRSALALGAGVVALAGVIAYHVTHPAGMASWTGVGYEIVPEAYLKTLLDQALILSPDRYAIHPRVMLERPNLWFFAAALALIAIIASPRLRRAWGVSSPRERSTGAVAIGLASLVVGPFLLVCNPLVVPFLVDVLDTAIPIPRVPDQYQSLVLACQYGTIAAALWLGVKSLQRVRYGRIIAGVSTAGIVAAAIVVPLTRPPVRVSLLRILAGQNPDILALSDHPLYAQLARLPRGIVAIEMPNAESVLMSTPHYVVSSTRMPRQRQRDNDTIVRYGAAPERIRELVARYRVSYAVVPLDPNVVINGEFSNNANEWDPVSSTLASVAGGVSGACLELTRVGSDGQFAYQNVRLQPGIRYRLDGYVKSGSSGDETFAIDVYGENASGTAVASVTGRTSGSWTKHSTTFTAQAPSMAVLLRKQSPTAGSMRFDDISVTAVESPLQRFRNSRLFTEVFATPTHAVFAVDLTEASAEPESRLVLPAAPRALYR